MSMTDKGKSYSVLTMNTLAFTVNFAIWTMFSIIGIRIREELGLSNTEFGLLVATPILTGSLTRIFLGVWTEKYGGRLVFSAQMILAALATWALTFADTYIMYLVAALGVGLIGGRAAEAVGRNPGAFNPVLIISLLGMAFAEGLAILVYFVVNK